MICYCWGVNRIMLLFYVDRYSSCCVFLSRTKSRCDESKTFWMFRVYNFLFVVAIFESGPLEMAISMFREAVTESVLLDILGTKKAIMNCHYLRLIILWA